MYLDIAHPSIELMAGVEEALKDSNYVVRNRYDCGQNFRSTWMQNPSEITLVSEGFFLYPGFDETKLLEAAGNSAVVAIVHPERSHVAADCIKAGALEVVCEFEWTTKLLTVLQDAEEKKRQVIDTNEAIVSASQRLGFSVSERELDIVKCIAQGMSCKTAARELGISHRTVEAHRRNLYLKSGCGNATQLALFCLANGLISYEDAFDSK